MFTAFTTPGQFWRGNIHGHSNRSDGALSPEDVCHRYREEGYDFITLTDHFMEAYGFPLTDTRPFRQAGFTTILGAELHAMGNSHGELWHILAVGLPDDFAPPSPVETGPELAARARAAGAFIAIAHPQWSQIDLQDALTIDAAHAVEVYNHTSKVNAERGGGATLYDQMLGHGCDVGCIAVDDSHWKVDDAFGGWVMVKSESLDPDALLKALRAGAYYASQGPEIHDMRIEDGELVVETSPIASAILVGGGSRARAVHGINMQSSRLPLDTFLGSWCRLVVTDADGRRAWASAFRP